MSGASSPCRGRIDDGPQARRPLAGRARRGRRPRRGRRAVRCADPGRIGRRGALATVTGIVRRPYPIGDGPPVRRSCRVGAAICAWTRPVRPAAASKPASGAGSTKPGAVPGRPGTGRERRRAVRSPRPRMPTSPISRRSPGGPSGSAGSSATWCRTGSCSTTAPRRARSSSRRRRRPAAAHRAGRCDQRRSVAWSRRTAAGPSSSRIRPASPLPETRSPPTPPVAPTRRRRQRPTPVRTATPPPQAWVTCPVWTRARGPGDGRPRDRRIAGRHGPPAAASARSTGRPDGLATGHVRRRSRPDRRARQRPRRGPAAEARRRHARPRTIHARSTPLDARESAGLSSAEFRACGTAN